MRVKAQIIFDNSYHFMLYVSFYRRKYKGESKKMQESKEIQNSILWQGLKLCFVFVVWLRV